MSAKAKILIVDDSEDFVESTKDLLEAHGYEVVCAHNGADGLALAKSARPALMILDVMMATNTEGFEVARQIPQTPELQGLPVVMVTGIRSEMKLGYKVEPDVTWLPVDRILEKPVDPAHLLSVIRKLLARRNS